MDRNERPMIRLAGVGKTYADGTVAVQEVDLDVPRGALALTLEELRRAGPLGGGSE